MNHVDKKLSLLCSLPPAKPFKQVSVVGRSQGEAYRRKVSFGMKTRWISIAGVLATLVSGCQCCPWFNGYANAIDDINETHVYFDRVYNPKYDLTRMGKPDWCSPFNRMFCPNCCTNGCYDRHDDCNMYPPLYPYEFPSYVMPPPTYRTNRTPRTLDQELRSMTDESTVVPPAPGANPPGANASDYDK